jgi:hypothetical protein
MISIVSVYLQDAGQLSCSEQAKESPACGLSEEDGSPHHPNVSVYSMHKPEHCALIERVPAIPSKRYDRAQIEFLTSHEIEALLAAPDVGTWTGRRDRVLLLVAVQNVLRV